MRRMRTTSPRSRASWVAIQPAGCLRQVVHMYWVPAPSRPSSLEIMSGGELQKLIRGKADAVPGVDVGQAIGESVELHHGEAAGSKHPADFAEIFENHIAAGDVLKDGVGIDEVEAIRRRRARGCSVGGVDRALGISRSFSRASAIISSETSTPWISTKWRLMGRIRRPGPQPISSARQSPRSCKGDAARAPTPGD